MIGLGNLGNPMAVNLLAEGYRLVVNSLVKTEATNLLDSGATWADSAAELATQVDVLITVLPRPEHVREVLIGGVRCPIAGTVTMDQILVDCGDLPVRPGDDVVLLGRQGDAEISAVEWATRAAELGAGEILLTSMDRDGTKEGFDIALTRAVSDAVDVPLIASGGVGTLEHMVDGVLSGGADAVLAMYHDQGLAVLKHASFGEGVNVTLGLPIIRTSVDHGTALDLAGKGNIEIGSMLAAIKLAIELTHSKTL